MVYPVHYDVACHDNFDTVRSFPMGCSELRRADLLGCCVLFDCRRRLPFHSRSEFLLVASGNQSIENQVAELGLRTLILIPKRRENFVLSTPN